MTMRLSQGLGLVSTMIEPLPRAYAPTYYRCVEVDDGATMYWEIYRVNEYRTDYVDTIDPDDMGDWISHEMERAMTHGVIDIRLITWDSFLQERYERQEERGNSE
jgi:hypothetical protein